LFRCTLPDAYELANEFFKAGSDKAEKLVSNNIQPIADVKLLGELATLEILSQPHNLKGDTLESCDLQTFGCFRDKLIETFVMV
jgi:hypothetical protein